MTATIILTGDRKESGVAFPKATKCMRELKDGHKCLSAQAPFRLRFRDPTAHEFEAVRAVTFSVAAGRVTLSRFWSSSRTKAATMNCLRACAVGVFSFGVLAGCKTLSVSSRTGVEVSSERGRLVLRSAKENVVELRVERMQFAASVDQLPTFMLTVKNGGRRAFEVSPSKITVLSGKARVRLYTSDELAKAVRDEKTLETRAKVSETIDSASIDAEQHPRGLEASEMAGENTTSTQPSRPARAVLGALRDMKAPVAEYRNDAGGIFERWQCLPGMSVAGFLKLHAEDIRSGQPLRFFVRVGGEVHEFDFDVTRALPRVGG
jgi:hypothetical protein